MMTVPGASRVGIAHDLAAQMGRAPRRRRSDSVMAVSAIERSAGGITLRRNSKREHERANEDRVIASARSRRSRQLAKNRSGGRKGLHPTERKAEVTVA